jgi:hypothetical protein
MVVGIQTGILHLQTLSQNQPYKWMMPLESGKSQHEGWKRRRFLRMKFLLNKIRVLETHIWSTTKSKSRQQGWPHCLPLFYL